MLPFSENVAALVALTTWFLTSKHLLLISKLASMFVSARDMFALNFVFCLYFLKRFVHWNGEKVFS